MADKRVTVTIEAVDKASDTIGNISKQLQSLGKLTGIKGLSSIGDTFGKINSKAGLAATGIGLAVGGFNKLYSASKQNFINGISKIGNVCKTIITSLAGLGRSFLDLVSQVSNSDLTLSGLIKTSANYDQTLQRIGIKSKASSSELSNLDKVMKSLTTDTVYSMSEIASAAEYMVQNGRTTTQVINELSGVTALATVGNVDLAKSADIVSGTLNMFNKQALTAQQVASIFATAANSSGANVENLAKSLENCGPQANLLGISLQETVGTLALMGNNMIRGGKAGTSLKNLFQRMSTPTKESAEAIKEYGLETAQALINSGRLKDGLIEMQTQFRKQKVTGDELVSATKKLAGGYGYAGLGAVIGTATDKMLVMYKAMEKGLVNTNDLTKGMDTLMGTIQGQLMRFSANMEVAFYNLFTNSKSSIAGVMNVLNDFFSNLNSGMSLESALRNLENDCSKIPQILSNAISNAISGIDNFINGGSLQSILNIGTNIIQGICKGIDTAYKNGSLTSAISGAIRNICDFINKNAPAIEKAGKQIMTSVKEGIKKNKTKINDALDTVIGVINSWAQTSGELKTTCGTFAGTLIDGFVEQVEIKAQQKATEFQTALFGSLFSGDVNNPDMQRGFLDNLLGFIGCGEGEPPKTFTDTINDFFGNLWENIFGGEAYAAEVEKGGTKATEGISNGLEKGKGQVKTTTNAIGQIFGQGLVTAVQQAQTQLTTAFTGITNSARTSFVNLTNIVRNQMVNTSNIVRNQALNMSNIFRNQFVNMANIVRNQMVNSANIVRNQCVNMANIFRNQFVSMANVARNQMVNVSNIIRNQAISWSNVIRNQVQNARNALTSSFLSMAAVARTQMVNISNIIRNQAVTWSNIIRNQAANARNALTSSFMGMAAAAASSMAQVLSVVQSYMSQIAAACNRTLTLKVNINKTETTTKKVVEEKAGLNLSIPQTSSLSSGMMRGAGTSIGLGTLVGGMVGANSGSTISLSIPVILEGREIAKASAIYTREELSKLEKRNNRKRGE